jgi:hypothetical protein
MELISAAAQLPKKTEQYDLCMLTSVRVVRIKGSPSVHFCLEEPRHEFVDNILKGSVFAQ